MFAGTLVTFSKCGFLERWGDRPLMGSEAKSVPHASQCEQEKWLENQNFQFRTSKNATSYFHG